LKLEQYRKLAQESYEISKKSAISTGLMGGSFFGIIIGFSAFSWTMGFIFINYELPNPM